MLYIVLLWEYCYSFFNSFVYIKLVRQQKQAPRDLNLCCFKVVLNWWNAFQIVGNFNDKIQDLKKVLFVSHYIIQKVTLTGLTFILWISRYRVTQWLTLLNFLRIFHESGLLLNPLMFVCYFFWGACNFFWFLSRP